MLSVETMMICPDKVADWRLRLCTLPLAVGHTFAQAQAAMRVIVKEFLLAIGSDLE